VEIAADGIAIMLVGREIPAAVGHSRGSTPEVTLP
jgi:hypothetical protein